MKTVNKEIEAAKKARKPVYIPNTYYKPEHDSYKIIADRTNRYLDGNIGNYKYSYSDINRDNGYYAQVYKNDKNKTYVISYKGSDNGLGRDWLNTNRNLLIRNKPTAFDSAEQTYQNLEKIKEPDYKIVAVGYSLGGSEAQMIGAKYGNETVTFNAYGVGGLNNIEINHTDNIVNYGNPNDFVFSARKNEHIGNVVDVPMESQNPLNRDKYIQEYHHLHTLGDLSKTRDDKYVDEYYNNLEKRKNERNISSGDVYVREYTRSDGTNVSSYTRSAPNRR